jgi:hypothetical protein
MLPLLFLLAFPFSTKAQKKEVKTPSETYAQAQDNQKSEKRSEKQKRKKLRRSDKEASAQVTTSPRHGWLFAKKRKKKMTQTERAH